MCTTMLGANVLRFLPFHPHTPPPSPFFTPDHNLLETLGFVGTLHTQNLLSTEGLSDVTLVRRCLVSECETIPWSDLSSPAHLLLRSLTHHHDISPGCNLCCRNSRCSARSQGQRFSVFNSSSSFCVNWEVLVPQDDVA